MITTNSCSADDVAAEHPGAVEQRQHAVLEHQHRLARHRAHRLLDRRCVRSIRSSGIANGAPETSTWRAETIASVSGRRIWASVPAPGVESITTSPPS